MARVMMSCLFYNQVMGKKFVQRCCKRNDVRSLRLIFKEIVSRILLWIKMKNIIPRTKSQRATFCYFSSGDSVLRNDHKDCASAKACVRLFPVTRYIQCRWQLFTFVFRTNDFSRTPRDFFFSGGSSVCGYIFTFGIP